MYKKPIYSYIYIYLKKNYIIKDRLINGVNLAIASFVAFAHFSLCLVILNAIIYCTGRSSLPEAYLNYCKL